MIKVLFFAQLAELAECDSLAVEYHSGLTPRSMLEVFSARCNEALVDYLKHDACVVSINKEMGDWDEQLTDGDEVAFLPPFSGG